MTFLIRGRKFIFLVLILAAPLHILYLIYYYGVTVPYWDEWELVPLLKKAYTSELTLLDMFWTRQNEHRIFFPLVILLSLIFLTNWNIMYELYLSLFFAMLIFLFLYNLMRQTISNYIPSWLSIVISFLVFSPSQWENWMKGGMFAFFLFILTAIIAVWSIHKWQGQLKGILISIGAAIISSYSFNGGLLTWIVIGILMLLQKERKWRYLLSWTAAFAVTVILYYYGYTKPVHYYDGYTMPARTSSLLFFMNHPYDFINYVLACIGSPLGFGNKDISIVIGILFVMVLCGGAMNLWRSDRENFNRLLPWLAIALYALLNVAAIAVGRLEFGVGQALASRYTTISTFFIISVLVIAVFWINNYLKGNKQLPTKLIAAISSLCTLLILSYILSFFHSKKDMMNLKTTVQRAEVCLENIETASDECLGKLYPNPDIVRERVKILSDLGFLKSFKKDIPWDNIQKIMGGQFSIDTINGSIYSHQVQPISIDVLKNNAVTIAGWAVDEKARDAADSVYITFDGKPIARAYYGVERLDVAAHFKIDSYIFSGWEVSIRLNSIAAGEHKISLRIVSKDRKSYYEPEKGISVNISNNNLI